MTADTLRDTCSHQVQCSTQDECDAKASTLAVVREVGERLVKHEGSTVERSPADDLERCYCDLYAAAKLANEGAAPSFTLGRLQRIVRRMMALGVR